MSSSPAWISTFVALIEEDEVRLSASARSAPTRATFAYTATMDDWRANLVTDVGGNGADRPRVPADRRARDQAGVARRHARALRAGVHAPSRVRHRPRARVLPGRGRDPRAPRLSLAQPRSRDRSTWSTSSAARGTSRPTCRTSWRRSRSVVWLQLGIAHQEAAETLPARASASSRTAASWWSTGGSPDGHVARGAARADRPAGCRRPAGPAGRSMGRRSRRSRLSPALRLSVLPGARRAVARPRGGVPGARRARGGGRPRGCRLRARVPRRVRITFPLLVDVGAGGLPRSRAPVRIVPPPPPLGHLHGRPPRPRGRTPPRSHWPESLSARRQLRLRSGRRRSLRPRERDVRGLGPHLRLLRRRSTADRPSAGQVEEAARCRGSGNGQAS